LAFRGEYGLDDGLLCTDLMADKPAFPPLLRSSGRRPGVMGRRSRRLRAKSHPWPGRCPAGAGQVSRGQGRRDCMSIRFIT